MNLFVTGDSWTSCWPLEEDLGHRDFGWPAIVSNHFNYNLIDKSRAASSNFRIFRKAFDAVNDPNMDIVLVFLSFWTRCESGSTLTGKIYQHVPNDKMSYEYFDEHFNGYLNYSQNLRMIIALQQSAKFNNKPCYILDTFNNNIRKNITIEDFKDILKTKQNVFDAMNDTQVEQKFDKIKFLTNLIDFDSFISSHTYEELIKGCALVKRHPIDDGHQKIAKVVIDFLESRNYGKTI